MIGETVRLRTKTYRVPSLSFDEVEKFALDGTLAKVPANGLTMLAVPESREAALSVLLSALRWNYPEIGREEVARELDLENCERAMAAIMGATKLTVKGTEPGEVEP